MNRSEPILLVERNANWATLTLNRPQKHNAMTLELWQTLHRTLLEFKKDRSISLIVLRGAGGHAFSAGMDIREEYQTFCTAVHEVGNAIHGCCRDLMQLPQVVLCVVDGYCFGAALELMLACDYVMADEKAVFSLPEMKVGIPCMVEAALLVQVVGLLKEKEMCRSSWVYNRLRRFRAGIESGISWIKRCFGLTRCTWKSFRSFKSYVWASIVSANLLSLARGETAT